MRICGGKVTLLSFTFPLPLWFHMQKAFRTGDLLDQSTILTLLNVWGAVLQVIMKMKILLLPLIFLFTSLTGMRKLLVVLKCELSTLSVV